MMSVGGKYGILRFRNKNGEEFGGKEEIQMIICKRTVHPYDHLQTTTTTTDGQTDGRTDRQKIYGLRGP